MRGVVIMRVFKDSQSKWGGDRKESRDLSPFLAAAVEKGISSWSIKKWIDAL
jgi:hypothetical protein